MINVTKTFLPPWHEYAEILKRAWDKSWVTNNGELLLELESKLKKMLKTEQLLFCSNGTVVLQMAIKALELKGEIITTPFSYVATTNAIVWENCNPVFVDINRTDFNIDVSKIEQAVTSKTSAILVTHVYGNPCNVEAIKSIADKYNLKVIYDGAHAFGVMYKAKSLLSYGDVSTCSFHATKLFHTVEGGAIIANDKSIAEKLMLYRQFGHVYDDYFSVGINAKNSEFHSAMGLAVLPYISQIIESRKTISNLYDSLLLFNKLFKPTPLAETETNFGYYPVVFENEDVLLKIKTILAKEKIFTRRYFYPSLNTLPFLNQKYICPVSEEISRRVLCLPVYNDLALADVEHISNIINKNI